MADGKDIRDSSRKVSSRLAVLGREITRIINRPPGPGENPAGWAFYKKKLSEITVIYNQMKEIWLGYSDKAVEETYILSVEKSKSLLGNKGFKTTKKKVIGQTFAKKSTNLLKNLTVSDYWNGLDAGKRDINKLFRLTQQKVISEKEISNALAKGLEAKGTRRAAGAQLEQLIQKFSVDGKVVTSSGRSYKAKTYADLVSRTRLAEAQSKGTIDTVLATGNDLVRVTDHNTTTKICIERGEGMVFSLTGKTPGFPILRFRTPFHPNCLHRITPFVQAPAGTKLRERDDRQQAEQIAFNKKRIKAINEKEKNKKEAAA